MTEKIETKRLAVLGALFILVIILAVIFFRSGGGEKLKTSAELPEPVVQQEEEEPPETKKVTLFFLSEEDALLHPEDREIVAAPSLVGEAEQTIEELIKGSENGLISPFPPETRLRQLFLTKEGILYVDFTKELAEEHLSGSSAEIATVYSLVNSLAYNFKAVRRVFILIDGRERETLAGHINLGRPFLPQYSLIAR